MTLDFESDQQVIDNLEAVTYTSVATAGNSTVAVPDAAFYPSQIAEGAPSAGVYVKYTGRFAIRNSLIGALPPKPADTITRADDGSVWTVLQAHPPVISGVWQIDCIDLILSNGLEQSGTLTRPSNTGQDAAGRQALTSYTTIASNVPCRVQPQGGDAGDPMARRAMIGRYTAFLGIQVVPQAKDVFTSAGQSYTVLGYKQSQRIDELMTLELELVDAPGGSSSGAPAASVPPAISGVPILGNLLTCSAGAWSLSPAFAYQWYSGGTAIGGATSSTYSLQASDLGNLITCQVMATSGSQSGVAIAGPVGPVAGGEGLTGTFP